MGGVSVDALTDPAKAAAISQVEISETKDGGQIVKFKLFDKRAALSDLFNHLALGRERTLADVGQEVGGAGQDIREMALAVISMLSEAGNLAREPPQIEGHAVQMEDEEFALSDRS